MKSLSLINGNFTLKLFLILTFVMCGYTFLLNPPKVSAQLNPNNVYPANYYSNSDWGGINFYNTWCPGIPQKYMHNSWISQNNVPTNNTSISVPYGTTTVNLEKHYHMFLCRDIVGGCWQYYYLLPCEAGITSRANMAQSLEWIDNAAIVGGQATIGTSPAGKWNDLSNELYFRYWDDTTPIEFSVVSTSPQGFTTDQTITVRLGGRSANRWGSNWYCVANGAPTAMAFGVVPANCPIGYSYFSIIVDVGPPTPQLSCGGVTMSPNSPEPGEDFTVTMSVSYTGPPTPSRPTHTMTVNVGTLYANANAAYTTNGSAAQFTTPNINSPAAGRHTVRWTLSGGRANPVNCSGTITIAAKPYLRVYGGDVLAGSGFGADCSPSADAKIIAYNNGNGVGAGTELAAQSISAITEFASALTRNQPPEPNKGLTFSNAGDEYGGDFGSGICAKDYFENATNPSGNTTIGATNVADDQHIVRYIDGNATITGNIEYTGSDSWTSLDDIPSYYLIVRGNIYIDSSVSSLDGVYIAQPTTTNPTNTGRIYTCTNGSSQIDASSLHATCSNKLTINGAFVAKQVKFLRTNGALKDSSNTEASSSNNIAEVFVYSPELYLVNPGITPLEPSKYDAITSLPPVL